MRLRLTLILSILLLAAFAPPAVVSAPAAEGGRAEAPYREGGYDPRAATPLAEDDLVILEILLDRYRVSQGMIGYMHPGGVLLPLGALCDALEFAIETRPNEGWARGWFIAENRTFSLDLGTRTVAVNGSRAGLDPLLARADGEDIYVDSELLAEWFPLDIDIRLSDMLVRLYPRETVPLQSRLKRDEVRANSLARNSQHDVDYPLRRAGYRPLSWPLIDANFDYVTRDENTDPRFSLQSSNDLAGLSTRMLLSHSEGKAITTARLRAGREVNDNSLLGPLQASRFEFGDIYSPLTPLVSRGKLGRGAFLSNQPLRRPTEFSSTTIEGDAPPGWEVELYANGTLLDFSAADESGHYRFENVPLQFGQNVFRTVVYGPQGQTREKVERSIIGSDMVLPGKLSYRLFSLQDEKTLIRDDEAVLNPSADYGAWNSYAELGFGVTPGLSLSGSVQSLSVQGEKRDYGSFTAHSNIFGLYTQTVFASDFTGGAAGQFSIQGGLGGNSINFEQRLYDDFVSDYNEPSQKLDRETILRFSGSTRSILPQGLSYDLKLESDSFAGRSVKSQDAATLRLASNIDHISLSNRMEFRRTDTDDSDYQNLQGEQLISSWLGDFMLRGRLRYRIDPQTEVQAIGGTATWRPHRNLTARLQVIRNIDDIAYTQIHTGLNWLLSGLNCGLIYSHSTLDQNYVSISFSTSLTRAPRGGGWHMQKEKMASGSAASAFVYLDRDADGRYGRDDEPMPGIGFTGSSLWRNVRTNDRGVAFLPGLPANLPRAVELDLTTLDDPFLIPSTRGLTAMGHTGGVVDLEFPVTYSGEIEGDVMAQTIGGEIPARHIGLELINSHGERIMTTVSEFDGYFLFQEVPPGWYEIRVLPHALKRRHVKAPAPIAMQIPAEGGVSAGHMIILLPDLETAAGSPLQTEPGLNASASDFIGIPAAALAPADTLRLRTSEEIFQDEDLDLIEKVLELEEQKDGGEIARDALDGTAADRAGVGSGISKAEPAARPAPAMFPGDTPSPSLPRRHFYGMIERPDETPGGESGAAANDGEPSARMSLLKKILQGDRTTPVSDAEAEAIIRILRTLRYMTPLTIR